MVSYRMALRMQTGPNSDCVEEPDLYSLGYTVTKTLYQHIFCLF